MQQTRTRSSKSIRTFDYVTVCVCISEERGGKERLCAYDMYLIAHISLLLRLLIHQ